MSTNGGFYWNELVTPDQKKGGDFYCSLLGWSRRPIDAGPFGTYTLFTLHGDDVAGMMNPTSDYSRNRPSWWSAYVAVNDVDASAEQAIKLGGTIVEPVTDIAEVGRACMVADPEGAVVCLITPIPTSLGGGEPKLPLHGTFVWNYLITANQHKTGEFYSGLLGWQSREMDAGPFGIYKVFESSGVDVAGMMNPTIEYTRSRTSQWYAYIAVDDVDACASRSAQLGGKVIEPPHDVPGWGRVCLIVDPVSAPVTLVKLASRS